MSSEDHLIEFYCPACGNLSWIDPGGRFQLAPGRDLFECPICETEHEVVVEFKMPLTTDPNRNECAARGERGEG